MAPGSGPRSGRGPFAAALLALIAAAALDAAAASEQDVENATTTTSTVTETTSSTNASATFATTQTTTTIVVSTQTTTSANTSTTAATEVTTTEIVTTSAATDITTTAVADTNTSTAAATTEVTTTTGAATETTTIAVTGTNSSTSEATTEVTTTTGAATETTTIAVTGTNSSTSAATTEVTTTTGAATETTSVISSNVSTTAATVATTEATTTSAATDVTTISVAGTNATTPAATTEATTTTGASTEVTTSTVMSSNVSTTAATALTTTETVSSGEETTTTGVEDETNTTTAAAGATTTAGVPTTVTSTSTASVAASTTTAIEPGPNITTAATVATTVEGVTTTATAATRATTTIEVETNSTTAASTATTTTPEVTHTTTATSTATITTTGTSTETWTVTTTVSSTVTTTLTMTTAAATTTVSSTVTTTPTSTTATTTTTTTTSTTTQDPADCILPVGGDGLNISDCFGRRAPATCSVRCAAGFAGSPSSTSYACTSAAAGFVGSPPRCTSTTTTTSVTRTATTTTTLPLCAVVPSGVGVNNSGCAGKVAGMSCTLSCGGVYQGTPTTLTCNATGSFEGPRPTCTKITCSSGLPNSSLYNTSACAGKEVGQACSVSCLPGYVPKRSVYNCLSTGSFAGDAPTCVRLPCTQRPSGQGVNSTACADRVAGDTCTVTCREGYSGTPVDVTCGLDGQFAATGGGAVAPTCALRTCDVPDSLSAAGLAHTCAGVKHGQRCVVSCADGYLGGSQVWQCSAPTLSGTLPSCVGKSCGRNAPFGDGVTSDCAGKTTGQNCTATCLPGYEGTGSGEVTCQASGAFTSSSLACARKQCSSLASVAGFEPPQVGSTCAGKVFKQTCSATCGDGYDLTGSPSSLRCGAGGSFLARDGSAPTPPSCSGRTCTRGKPDGRGVTSDCEGKTTGQTCTASSAPGFSYQSGGAKNLTCDASGVFQWSDGEVQVEPGTCDAFPTWGTGVANSCTGKSVGTQCWAYCKDGYSGDPVKYECSLVGSTLTIVPSKDGVTISCAASSSRRLEPEPARRLTACATAPTVPAGVKTTCTAGQADGTNCIMECADGYNISGSPVVYACSGGAFSYSGAAQYPTCVAVPCTYKLPSGVGVTDNCAGVGTGSTCTASCGAGYSGTSATFTCQSTGEFSGTSPTCTAQACTALALGAQYATSACAGKTTGQTCLVGCADGYTGDTQAYTCGTSGAFSGTAPTCVAAQCTSGVPTGADVSPAASCSSLTTGQTCSVACANGYTGTAATFTCSASGSLTGTLPTCTRQTCADLTPNASYAHTCTSRTMGTSCTVSCATGYQLAAGSAVQTWQCDWDSSAGGVTLQGTYPSCPGVPCVDNIPSGDTVVHDCGSVPTGSTCTASCAAGYTGSAQTLTCQASGALSGSLPTCSRATCSAALSTASYDASSCAGVLFGDSCTLACQPGYDGTATAKACQLDAANTSVQLAGTTPSCTAAACIYNLPVGAEFSHNCTGVVTGGFCNVGCADGWLGDPTTFTCGADQALVGALPTCLWGTSTGTSTTSATTTTTGTSTTQTVTTAATTARPTTTAGASDGTSTALPSTSSQTATATATSTRTRTATTRTSIAPGEKVTTVSGSMTLQVADPAAFAADPDAQAAVEQGVARVAGVPAAYVNASLSVVPAGSRRLQSGSAMRVKVVYVITIPDAAGGLPPVGNITIQLAAADQAAMTAAINAAISDVVPGRYSVQVLTISQPQPSTSGDRGTVSTSTSTGTDNTPIVLGAVFGSLAGCCICCGLVLLAHRLLPLTRQDRAAVRPEDGIGPEVRLEVRPLQGQDDGAGGFRGVIPEVS